MYISEAMMPLAPAACACTTAAVACRVLRLTPIGPTVALAARVSTAQPFSMAVYEPPNTDYCIEGTPAPTQAGAGSGCPPIVTWLRNRMMH